MAVSLHSSNEDKITLQKALKIKVNKWNFRNLICFLQLVFGDMLFAIRFHTDAEAPWCLICTVIIHSQWVYHTKILRIMLFCSSWFLPFVLALYKKLGVLYSLCTIVYNSTFPDECMMNN